MITPALISGSVIGRMKFLSWCIFVVAWTTVVYDSVAHMVWSAWDVEGTLHFGWLRQFGALDYAGTVAFDRTRSWMPANTFRQAARWCTRPRASPRSPPPS